MRGSTHAPDTRDLAAYLEGELSRSEAEMIDAAAARCGPVQQELEALRRIHAAIAAVDEGVGRRDLVPTLRQAIDREATRRDPAPRPRRLRLALGLLLAGGLLAALATVSLRLHPGELRAKGGPPLDEDAWVGLHVLRTAAPGRPVHVEGMISARDALLFAYSNGGLRPFSHLMIFAVDDGGQVYWYFPAYQRSGTDPASIPIEARADVELREAVRHELRSGPLALFALFTRSPLRVHEIEAALGELARTGRWSAAAPRPLPFTRSAQKILRLRVTP